MKLGHYVCMDLEQALNNFASSVAYNIPALTDGLSSIDFTPLILAILNFLPWLILSASLLLIFDVCLRYALCMTESVLVSVLYLCAIPWFLISPWIVRGPLKSTTVDDSASSQQQGSSSSQQKYEHFTSLPSESPAEQIDCALIDLGVPLSATDAEIRRAYRNLMKQYHPDFFATAPKNTQERARRMTLKVRKAYDTAIGKKLVPFDS